MALQSNNMDAESRDIVGNVLKWVLLFVGIGTFALLFWTTIVTYRTIPPQPDRFMVADGTVVMTADDILAGKGGFQQADLMDYGSIYGMGSYFGEDYTASTLVELGTETQNNIALSAGNLPFKNLSAAAQAAVTTQMQSALQGVDLTKQDVVLPPPLADAIVIVRDRIAKSFSVANPRTGWTPAYSLTPQLSQQTADFIIYSALTTVARRPGTTWSWTQNWPFEPLVGNTPTTNTFIWTWISFCFTFFAFGLVLFVYQYYLNEPDNGPMDPVLAKFRPLTPSQRRIGKYFLVVAALLLVQIGAGSVMAHSYYDRGSFYGIPVNNVLPFNFLRDVHIQAPLAWIGLSWIGAGLFLAPAIAGGKEAKGQHILVDLLFWATLLVVGGGLIGNYLGIMGVVRHGWFWFGNQGLSYIQLGRFWQLGFFLGLVLWSVLVLRALWPEASLLRRAASEFWTGNIRLENLIWASTVNIAVLYAFGMIPLTGIERSFTLTDFWRWWVVHLWVEQSFEFFAACMTSYLLMAVGLVSRKLAERAVYLELILVFLGGVIGTGHHLYWVGGPGMWVPMGSMFSFIEVLPLLLLIMDAVTNYRLIKAHHEFKYKVAYTYILGAAFWNFVGAGVFGGGTLNAPLINYYEHGTFLTLNHAHTALFGAFGELGIGLIYFCLRYIAADEFRFSNRLGIWSFWLYNGGMAMWIFLNFFPIGWPQLAAVYEHGLAFARSQEFYDTTILWQWMRLPGDVVFALGALLMAWDFIVKLRPLYPTAIDRVIFRTPVLRNSEAGAD